jgi:holliday junction DNA helicase RuvA
MIAALRGKVLHRGISRLVVDVQGVGYDVAVTLSTLEALPPNGEIFLHVHTVLRENALELFGFLDRDEKVLFELLLTVSGIGPRTALTILSGISPAVLHQAVLENDISKLTTIPGVGKKSAERMVLELRERMQKVNLSSTASTPKASRAVLEDDLVSSLVNLGYKERIALEAAKRVLKTAKPEVSLAQAVRLALKELIQ